MSTMVPLQAPFPYFGGKARAATLIWNALGNVQNYVEPMFGSGAVLLARPHAPKTETVNDLDCHIVNLFRAIQHDPDGVARLLDEPVNEITQHAYHWWLIDPERREAFEHALMGDPDYYDLLRAARWLYGACTWIGSGWCSGTGAWQVKDGQFVKQRTDENRQLPHLGNAGQGIHRKRPHLGNAGRGIHRQPPHLGNAGRGNQGVSAWMQALSDRLQSVRVCCGDWTRVLGPSVTFKHGTTGIFLDPPYAQDLRQAGLYTMDNTMTDAVQAWCLANGEHPLLRIVLCGYAGEYALPRWRQVAWHTNGGFSNQNHDRDNQNKYQERLWLSPYCLHATPQLTLFASPGTPPQEIP